MLELSLSVVESLLSFNVFQAQLETLQVFVSITYILCLRCNSSLILLLHRGLQL